MGFCSQLPVLWTLCQESLSTRNYEGILHWPLSGNFNESNLRLWEIKTSNSSFTGAIGRAYHKLYEPFMPYKDEIYIRTGLEITNKLTQLEDEIALLRKENERLKQNKMSNENTSAIVRVWSFCNPLRDIGVGYGDYLEQLTYLLFLKMADEFSKPPITENTIPTEHNWEKFDFKAWWWTGTTLFQNTECAFTTERCFWTNLCSKSEQD